MSPPQDGANIYINNATELKLTRNNYSITFLVRSGLVNFRLRLSYKS